MRRRRESHTASMLKPTVSVVQGQQQQQHGDHRDTRRSSEPGLTLSGVINGVGGFAARQLHHPQVPMGQNNLHPVAPPRPNFMQWQPQQRQAIGQQASTRHHSFASSMDLITPSNPASQVNGNTSSFQPFQNNNLFKSSSHHTSHTAAAGDLLTMSRRALNPPPANNQNNVMAKKRSATLSPAFNGNGSNTSQFQFNVMNTNGSNPNNMGENHTQSQWPQQQQKISNAPQHNGFMDQSGGDFPINSQDEAQIMNDPKWPPFEAAAYASNVSSSTVGTVGDNDDSYQQHRTVRRCRRSDSFEMMEGG